MGAAGINLKSDSMNPPTEAMWEAMRAAQPGWVLDRADANVRALEAEAADWMGKEAGVLLPTGRVACLVALMTCCERGTQVVLGQSSHMAWCQEWNLAYVAGLFPRSFDDSAGRPEPQQVEEAITESRFGHRPLTSLVCLENTHNMAGGRCFTAEHTEAVCAAAGRHRVPVFLDGARLLYAATALRTTPARLAAPADVVMVSLTKGLSAPAGAVLCGRREVMDRAWHNARRLGVASLQFAGPLAAAGRVALHTMQERLAEDISNARHLGQGLSRIPGIRVELDSLQTNIVMAGTTGLGVDSAVFLRALEEHGVSGHRLSEHAVRFVTHSGVGPVGIRTAIDAVAAVVRRISAGSPHHLALHPHPR